MLSNGASVEKSAMFRKALMEKTVGFTNVSMAVARAKNLVYDVTT